MENLKVKRKAQFLSDLQVKQVNEKQWILTADLVYESKVLKDIVTVPDKFVTDFASVPRIPIVYLATGGVAQKAAVVHDYLYTTRKCSKFQADRVFLEAMKVIKVPLWRRQVMYWAVCLFGWKAYCD